MRSLLLSLLLAASPAYGAAPCKTMEDCVSRMQAANTAKDYAAAQGFAEAAYALSPDPNLLYNLGRFHRRQGHLREALDHYQRFLDSDASSLTEEVRVEVQGTIAKLQAELATPAPQQAPQPPQQATQPSQQAPQQGPGSAETSRRSRWLLWTGLPAAGVGVGLLTFGGIALSQDGRCVDDARPCQQVYDSQVQGLATVIPGAVLLGVGITMIGLDLAGRRGSRPARAGLAQLAQR